MGVPGARNLETSFLRYRFPAFVSLCGGLNHNEVGGSFRADSFSRQQVVRREKELPSKAKHPFKSVGRCAK